MPAPMRYPKQPLWRHFNPTRVAHFFGSGKTPPIHCHFMVHFGWDQNAFVE